MAEAADSDNSYKSARATEAVSPVRLSSQVSDIPAIRSSIQTVSETCQSIKESNAYVKYGVTMAETSVEKAMEAGKAILESKPLAPISNAALEKVRCLDKQAGEVVDRMFISRQEKEIMNAESSTLDNRNESTLYFLERTLFQVTSFLITLPIFVPTYAFSTMLNLFRRISEDHEIERKEPLLMKRKYGDSQSTSSEEETLVEVLHDYVSEEDPDYDPGQEPDESSKESEHESAEEDRDQSAKECLSLTEDLKEMGIPLSPETKRNVEKIISDKKELDEISSKESAEENKDKTGIPEDGKESKKTKDSSKSRRSTRSPLLERLLSPGRRSRKSQKDHSKTTGKEVLKDVDGDKSITEEKEDELLKKSKAAKLEKESGKSSKTEAPITDEEEILSTVTAPIFESFKMHAIKST